jgi:hypothetical protein
MEGISIDAGSVPPYHVLCVETDDDAGEGHNHVSVVDTRDPDGGQTRWTIGQVIAAVRDGERFIWAR